MASNMSLYGTPRPKTSSKSKEISSSSSLAFSSQLSSLLAQTSTSPSTPGRSRPSKSKTDIFTAHNKNTRKRAAVDISEDGIFPGHQQDIGGVDSTILHRSKRKMEEKARLYAAMKRGDYVPPSGTDNRRDEGVLVDFDRKWAEDEAAGRKPNYETSSDSGGDGEEDEELVDYEDEFGRQRRGTQAEAAREERRKNGIAQAADEVDRFSARPAPPSQIIYGDTVQTAAFNPDEPIAAQMEEIARKRDRSMTPPDEVHYDANGEVRTKGVGFYSFSKDKEGRKREMEALEKERLQTERERKEKEERKDKRKEEIEARRRLIREKQAERFLEGLD